MEQSLRINIDPRGVAYLTLNRPEKHNAFDAQLILRLTQELRKLAQDNKVRVVVLTGHGESFSSGADLTWMQSMVDFDAKTNQQDARQLADLMHELYHLRIPTIARVNGSAYGGALGLITCSDIAIAVDHAKYAFSEVKLGIIPAVIAPYIIAVMGVHAAKRLFLTGEIFTATEAYKMGLLHKIVNKDHLDEAVEKQIQSLLRGGPVAHREIKKLVHSYTHINHESREATCKLIAQLRTSEEGQEGLKAFLEKRTPHWINRNT